MGYHLTITRKKGNSFKPILLNEWESFVKLSNDLFFEKSDGGHVITAWKIKDEPQGWLSWSKGEIWTNGADDAFLEKMIEIADALNARVCGDEGEYYKTANESYYDADEKGQRDKEVKKMIAETKWKTILFNASIFSFFLVMALIVRACSK